MSLHGGDQPEITRSAEYAFVHVVVGLYSRRLVFVRFLSPPVNAGTVIEAFMLRRSSYVSRTATLRRLSVSSSVDTVTGSVITERFVLR